MTRQLTPAEEIWRGILLGQRSMLLRLAIELRHDFGLSVPDYEALLALRDCASGLKATDLGRSLLYSSGSTTHLIRRLHAAGLVERRPLPEDGRVVLIALTEAGHSLIERAQAAHRQSLEREFAPLVDAHAEPTLLTFAQQFAAHEGIRPDSGEPTGDLSAAEKNAPRVPVPPPATTGQAPPAPPPPTRTPAPGIP